MLIYSLKDTLIPKAGGTGSWQASYYWSSPERGTSSWSVDFNNGTTNTNDKTGNNYVRCVRSE